LELDDHNGNGYYDIKDFVEAPEKEILKFNEGMKFDVILANPPYDNGLHEKFSIKYFDICDGEICWVSPLSFLLGKRQNKKLTVHLDKYATDIEQINGNEYFDAAIGGTMGIVYVDMSDKYSHYVKFDGKEYDECSEISMISNDDLLMEFKLTIDKLADLDNVDNHINATKDVFAKTYIKQNPKDNPYIIIMQRYSGQSSARSKEIGEFYAIYSKDRSFNNMSGYFNDLLKIKTKSNTPFLRFYINLKNKDITYNFWKYTHTLFFTTSLRLYKSTLDLISGKPLSHIPWFDFSDPIFEGTPEEIDMALFKKYNIRQEIIDHIVNDLPNYYDLDLDKYKG